jgi:tetratricopeptide (TPR) repeat protein
LLGTQPLVESSPDLPWLQARLDRVRRTGRGDVVFLAGEPGAGRSALIRRFATLIEAETVVLTSFHRAQAAPAENQFARSLIDRLKRAAGPLEDILGELQLGGLISQLVTRTAANYDIAKRVVADSDNLTLPDIERLTRSLLRRLCEERPAVWLVDYGEERGGAWWNDWVALFARRLVRNLPLMLVVSLDGPEQLGEHEEAESDGLFVARQLVLERIATWRPVARVDAERLRAWIATTADVPEALIRITGGLMGWTADLWDDWKASGRVTLDSTRRWILTAQGTPGIAPERKEMLRRIQPFALQDQAVASRLVGVLGVAALEGKCFTLDALARVLRVGRSQLIGYLRATVASNYQLAPAVLTLALTDDPSNRRVVRCEFARHTDWLLFRQHGVHHASRREVSSQLAEALHDCYSGQTYLVADSLVSLYKASGDHEQAAAVRRDARRGASAEMTLWRAQTLLDEPAIIGRAAQDRAIQVFLDAANILITSGPAREGIDFAIAVLGLEPTAHEQALAYRRLGALHIVGGDFDAARRALAEAASRFSAVGDQAGFAYSRLTLGIVESEKGDRESALNQLKQLPTVFEDLDDQCGEAQARNWLGNLLVDHDSGAAEEEYQLALAVATAADYPHEIAHAHNGLADVAAAQGRDEEARESYVEALTIERGLGNIAEEAKILTRLANVDARLGNLDAARYEAELALRLNGTIGAALHEARARYALGHIYALRGERDAAATELEGAAASFADLGMAETVTAVRAELRRLHD